MTTFVNIKCPQLDAAKAGLVELASMSEKGALHAVARGLMAWGQITATKAKYVTPKDTGNLRASIFADVKKAGGVARLTIAAGGPAGRGNVGNETNKKDVGYAQIVHEQLGQVKWRTPGTGPKYLERPIKEEMPKLPGEVKDEIDKALERAMKK